MDTNIQQNYNLIPKSPPEDYAYMLLPVTKTNSHSVKYEGITYRSNTIWCMLYGLQNI